MDISTGQTWKMISKSRADLPTASEGGWPTVVKVQATFSELELALVVPAESVIHYSPGQRIRMPFSVLRRHYRKERG